MARVIDIASEHAFDSRDTEKSEFAEELLDGFTRPRKMIKSKYFYDEQGSELFNQITRHPDYYLTRCEIEILSTYKKQMAELFDSSPFNLVELGPGEGIKAEILTDEFLKAKLNFTYIPVDISMPYLKSIVRESNLRTRGLELMPIHADFFRGLEWLRSHSSRRSLVLFLGSSIGNFDPAETLEFLRHLSASLKRDDYVLLGFDLRKDIDILMRAYNDSDGITRDFNLNLLRRINHELGADFDLGKFRHYATYNVYSGAMESYLVSLEEQTVSIEATGHSFVFDAIEPIHVEYSHKYLLSQVNELAQQSGFEVVRNFMDSRKFFVDALWRMKT
ncbi:Histidine-specific methyltransferase EgtD [Aquicella siphonis]|uniref:Histidine-specific methyltransferase EgtD n=1 Tax=Aquicella siphonis TaxID=254247 RepID=A0A5E4PF29_9COXI|nr:L-histidine N(alpha)-methyltransferase [Aquicella siphonis]VVC74936.1 Histidine-specific methyltransferase EgtD [Aquicella siphonis]